MTFLNIVKVWVLTVNNSHDQDLKRYSFTEVICRVTLS